MLKKVFKVVRKLNLLIFYISYVVLKLIKEMIVEMMMVVRMVFGVYLNKGVSVISVMSIIMVMMMLDMVVLIFVW